MMAKTDKGSWNTRSSTLWQTMEWSHFHSSHAPHHHITDELCSTLQISKGSVMKLNTGLGYSKVWAQW